MPEDNADTDSVLFRAWWGIFRNQRLTVRQVIITALEGGEATAELRAALTIIAPSDYPGTFSPHRLGRWLVRQSTILQTLDNKEYRFVHRGAERHQQVWQIIPEEVTVAA